MALQEFCQSWQDAPDWSRLTTNLVGKLSFAGEICNLGLVTKRNLLHETLQCHTSA